MPWDCFSNGGAGFLEVDASWPRRPSPHLRLLCPPQCNNSEIRPGKPIGVCISVANNRLFVGSIPKSKTKEQIVEEFAKVTGESEPALNRRSVC